MLPWLHLQNFHFSESGMEVVSIQENYFHESSFAEFLPFEKIRKPRVEPFQHLTNWAGTIVHRLLIKNSIIA